MQLVGVLSGEHRLTIFLHRFETGEPVKDARIFLSAGEQEIEAVRKEHGVFERLRTVDQRGRADGHRFQAEAAER